MQNFKLAKRRPRKGPHAGHLHLTFVTIQALEELINRLGSQKALNSPVQLPSKRELEQICKWDHRDLYALTFKLISERDVESLAALVDLLVYGVTNEKYKQSDFFLLLELCLESLPKPVAQDFWKVVETRPLGSDLVSTKAPGLTLFRAIVALLKRLDPLIDTELRARIEVFTQKTFGSNERSQRQDVAHNLILDTTSQTAEGSEDKSLFSDYCKLQRGLAAPLSVVESEQTLEDFLDLSLTFAKVIESPYNSRNPAPEEGAVPASPIILDEAIFPGQLVDPAWQARLAQQVLLFIEAILMLAPALKAELAANKTTKAFVWSSLELGEPLEDRARDVKKAWFLVLRDSCSQGQMNIFGNFVKTEKLALRNAALPPKQLELQPKVNLDSEFSVKERKPHFHKIGNLALTQLLEQPLGEQFFARPTPFGSAAEVFDQAQKSEGDEREGALWLAMRLRRSDWTSLDNMQGTSAVFGAPATPQKRAASEDPEGPSDKRAKLED